MGKVIYVENIYKVCRVSVITVQNTIIILYTILYIVFASCLSKSLNAMSRPVDKATPNQECWHHATEHQHKFCYYLLIIHFQNNFFCTFGSCNSIFPIRSYITLFGFTVCGIFLQHNPWQVLAGIITATFVLFCIQCETLKRNWASLILRRTCVYSSLLCCG